MEAVRGASKAWDASLGFWDVDETISSSDVVRSVPTSLTVVISESTYRTSHRTILPPMATMGRGRKEV